MTNHTSHDVDAVPARIEATIRTVVADSRSRIRKVIDMSDAELLTLVGEVLATVRGGR